MPTQAVPITNPFPTGSQTLQHPRRLAPIRSVHRSRRSRALSRPERKTSSSLQTARQGRSETHVHATPSCISAGWMVWCCRRWWERCARYCQCEWQHSRFWWREDGAWSRALMRARNVAAGKSPTAAYVCYVRTSFWLLSGLDDVAKDLGSHFNGDLLRPVGRKMKNETNPVFFPCFATTLPMLV